MKKILLSLLLATSLNLFSMSEFITIINGTQSLEKVDTYLRNHPKLNLNTLGDFGQTAMHWAAARNRVGLMNLLVKHGAKIDSLDKLGKTPLATAASCGHHDAAYLLLKNGALINFVDNNGSTPLHYAASKVSVDLIRLLIDSGANINKKNKQGNRPIDNLVKAYINCKEKVRRTGFSYLLKAGAKNKYKN